MNLINEIGNIVEETEYDISINLHPGGELFIYVVDLRSNVSEFVVLHSKMKKKLILDSIKDCIRRIRNE